MPRTESTAALRSAGTATAAGVASTPSRRARPRKVALASPDSLATPCSKSSVAIAFADRPARPARLVSRACRSSGIRSSSCRTRCDDISMAESSDSLSRAERHPADFGDLTWLRYLDDDDLAQFVTELRQTLSLAYHDDDLALLVDAVAEWKATADELADPARREVLLGAVDAADFVEVARPEPHR